tara:strand:- start:3297 stop:4127 length:831 start_codon:yes stop_codon:yes gene_type:complete
MATLISSISGGMVRELAGEIPTMELVFFRNIVALLVLVPIIRLQTIKIPNFNQAKLYIIRVALAYTGMVMLFFALAHMPIADVYALQYTTPLFTMILAVTILKQQADKHSWAACLIGFIGTLIVMRPGIIEITLASSAALTMALLYAGTNTTIKLLARQDSPEVITLWTNMIMLPFALLPALFFWVTPTLSQWPLVIGIAIVSSIGGYCFTRSVSAAEARIVQPFQFSRMIFATAIGWIMFSELPDIWTWIGAGVIFAASYYIVYREGFGKRKQQT